MNSKIRALVWEELRVGGSIVAALLAVSVVCLVIIRGDGYMGALWARSGESCLAVVLGVPMLCSLLLALNTRNSGHLGGGFSPRILRLPVDTSTAVAVQLAVRLAGIVLLTLALSLTAYVLFGHGAGWRTMVLMAGIYLITQTLDWSRAVMGVLGWVAAGIGLALLLYAVGVRGLWEQVIRMNTHSTPALMAAFAAGSMVLGVSSLALVGWTRRGNRFEPFSGVSLAEWMPQRRGADAPPFASARAAHRWYHLRQNGFLMPKLTLALWVLGVLLFWLVDGFFIPSPTNNHGPIWFASQRNLFLISQVMPFLALLAAACGWRAVVGMGGHRRGRQALAWTTRLPITRAEAARTRLTVAGFSLAEALGAVALVYVAAYCITFFLLTNHFLLTSLFGAALAHGEASMREVVTALLGPVFLFGLLAWIIMSVPARLTVFCLGTAVGLLLLGLGAADLDFLQPHRPMIDEALNQMLIPFALWLVGLAPSALLLANLAALGRAGWVRHRSIGACLALWAGITLALYPFAWKLPLDAVPVAVVYCAALAALAVLPWPQMVLASTGKRRDALHRENPAQHARLSDSAPYRHRPARVLVLLALLGGVAWLRWPATPTVISALHGQGLPATLEELDQWYTPVPAPENLANRYLEAVRQRNSLNGAWTKQAAENSALQPGPGDTKTRDALDNVILQGDAKVKRTEPIPAVVWTTTRDYAAAVAEPVAAQLHEAARSGLRQSRYPIDLRQGFSVALPHLAEVRALARDLGVKALVAAVERRPEDAAAAVLDTIPLGNSLAAEPILISQLVRMAILGIAEDTLETVMNRTELPAAVLVRLQDGLARALPPLAEGPFLSRCLAGEEAIALAVSTPFSENYLGKPRQGRMSSPEALANVLTCVGADLAGWDKTERMVMERSYRSMRDVGLTAAQTGGPPDMSQSFTPLLEGMAHHAPVSSVMLPAMLRTYDSEWRIRTQLNLAVTALAVDRYRLANGRLPERLEELVPAFLDRVATDPWNGGKPLSYRVKENGKFLVYSLGQNGTDEKGEEVRDWWLHGDITFTVAPPEIRNRPQVADTPVAAGVGT